MLSHIIGLSSSAVIRIRIYIDPQQGEQAVNGKDNRLSTFKLGNGHVFLYKL